MIERISKKLKSVLCNGEGFVSISGSDEDKRIIKECIDNLEKLEGRLDDTSFFEDIFGDKRESFNKTCQLCCDKTLSIYFQKLLKGTGLKK